MNEIIRRAHEIRKEAAAKFGGRPRDYSLKIACEMAKNGEKIEMKNNKVEESVITLTAKQAAVRKIVQDTINSIKPHLLCQTAPAEVYEQLAMIYSYHRSCKMSHNDAINRSFSRLNGNGVSNADMIRLAQDTINKQSDIVAKITAMM